MNPDIKQGLLSNAHRNKMCELAIESSDWVELDNWETSQDEYVTTYVALQHFRQSLDAFFPKEKIEIKVVCGADLLESMTRPGVWDDNDVS
jgi:nicotinamide mononucleotide adenylyltransferase